MQSNVIDLKCLNAKRVRLEDTDVYIQQPSRANARGAQFVKR